MWYMWKASDVTVDAFQNGKGRGKGKKKTAEGEIMTS
jgi:hypothetical protein